MPTTDRDAQALTYLATRLRDDTHGCGTWDHAGTYAAVSKLIGTNLFEAIERVTRHAVDREARTPGAIGRGFLPDKPTAAVARDTTPKHLRCVVCFLPQPECDRRRPIDPDPHEFTTKPGHKLAPEAAAMTVQALRQARHQEDA